MIMEKIVSSPEHSTQEQNIGEVPLCDKEISDAIEIETVDTTSIDNTPVTTAERSSVQKKRSFNGQFVQKTFEGCDGDFFGIVTEYNAPYHKVCFASESCYLC
jgi:hypothetical protein